MKTYIVVFSRKDGTKGHDYFTSNNRTNAIDQFYDTYRNGLYEIVYCVEANINIKTNKVV